MTKYKDVTEAKLATIVTDTEVAFNVGEKGGVRTNDLVTLYDRVPVNDPDSGRPLGSVRVPRLNLKVYMVSENFCVARVTDRVKSRTASLFGDAATVRALKKVRLAKGAWTGSEDDADAVVEVEIGETVMIRRDLDEPPF